jgi:serine/threonine protein kinase
VQSALCPACQTPNRDGALFCVKCGGPLAPFGRPPTGPLQPGVILRDRYCIVGALGQGATATVYRARDIQVPGQYRALKEMRADGLPPDSLQIAAQSFWTEAQMLATLDHPCIPKVLEWFEQFGRFYLVMEWIEGLTLDRWFEQRHCKPFDEPEVVRWGIQLCDALAYMHEHNPPIIYRDLKPENIVIDPGGQARLIDFGIARTFKPGQERDTVALGTPGYAPPEQHGGQTDARSDLYALGAVMHQLLSGCDPQSGQLFSFAPVRKLNPSVSPQIEQILLRALKGSADARFPSARAMQQELVRLTTAPIIEHRQGQTLPKMWIGLGAGIVFTSMVLIYLVGVAAGWVPAPPPLVKTATPTPVPPTETAIPILPTATDTPRPTWTATVTPKPTSTPIESETPAPTMTANVIGAGTVDGLRANLERLKDFLESSSSGQFQCSIYAVYYRSVIDTICNGCQAATDRMRQGGSMLYDDCAAQNGTRSVQSLKLNAAKSAAFEALGALPR